MSCPTDSARSTAESGISRDIIPGCRETPVRDVVNQNTVTRSTREKHCKTGEFEDSSERAPPDRIRAVIELVIADPAAGAADPLATTQSQHVKTHPSRNSMGLD